MVAGFISVAIAALMDSFDPAAMSLRTERLEQTIEESVELLGFGFFALSLFFAQLRSVVLRAGGSTKSDGRSLDIIDPTTSRNL